MKTLLCILCLLCLNSIGAETLFGFDVNVPEKIKKIVRPQLWAAGLTETRKHAKWNTPHVLRICMVPGGNVNNNGGFPNDAVAGEVDRGAFAVAWVYRAGNISICVNDAYHFAKGDLATVLTYEVSIALNAQEVIWVSK